MTFNKVNTYQWFRDRVYKLEEAAHDPTDFRAAMDKALEWGAKIPCGLFYRNPDPHPSLDALDPALTASPLVEQELGLSQAQRAALIAEFL